MNCEVTSVDGYRETMFNILPQLKYLDNVDKDGGKKKENFLYFDNSFLIFCLVEKDSDDEDDDDEEDELEEGNENGASDGGKRHSIFKEKYRYSVVLFRG
jgi:hypothetical protein